MALPNELLIIKSCDKEFHEKYYKSRNMMNYVHPFRMVLSGKPNCGKSSYVKNAIIRAEPPFEKIYIIHADSEAQEWKHDIPNIEILEDIPEPSFFSENEEKTLVVLDDISFTNLTKEQKSNLGRLFGFVSTHCNVSVACCNQNFFDIAPVCRKLANIWVVWRPASYEELNTIGRRVGIKNKNLQRIFDRDLRNYHDSLTVDLTVPEELRLKKNGFTILNEDNYKK